MPRYIILAEQKPADETDWPEYDDWDSVACCASIRHDGATWVCTRWRGHPPAIHAAHYDADFDWADGQVKYGDSIVGVAWIEVDDEDAE